MNYLSPLILILFTLLPLKAQSRAELYPHFRENAFQYVGEFYNNHAYIFKNADGKLGDALADGKYTATIMSAREQVFIVFRRPTDGQFAVVDPSDPEAKKIQPSDLKFQVYPKDSIIVKAWEFASNPQAHESDRANGRLQRWLAVGVDVQTRQTERFYVGAETKTDPKSSFQLTPLLVVTEERLILFLDPANRKYAPVISDSFGSPLDPIKYRDMADDSMAAAVWKQLKQELGKSD